MSFTRLVRISRVSSGRLACRPRASSSSNDKGANDQQKGGRGFGKQPENAADALRRSLGDISTNIGRVSKKTNVVMGTDLSEEKWRELDSQVNEYPGQRTFKAIGFGGDDFVEAMRGSVEVVLGKVHEECVSTRLSAKGNYISVTIGPVWVEHPDQNIQIYENMRADSRLKFFI